MVKWVVRLFALVVLLTGMLIGVVLNPSLSYAHKTTHRQYTIYHHQPLDSTLLIRLDEATSLLETSEYHNPKLHLDICLNDGSIYPPFMQKLRGQAFAWGFYNKVVLMGEAHFADNYVELNGYRWNLTQLLAHEVVHCLQFDRRGFWQSNPVAKLPEWKWEGYPEYIARQNTDQKDLSNNIKRLKATEQTEHNGWIQFADSTGTVIPYYQHWLLVQYCMEGKQLTYEELLADPTDEKTMEREMMDWYQRQLGSAP